MFENGAYSKCGRISRPRAVARQGAVAYHKCTLADFSSQPISIKNDSVTTKKKEMCVIIRHICQQDDLFLKFTGGDIWGPRKLVLI